MPLPHLRRSWWFIFLARQVVVHLFVSAGSVLTIDILALRTTLFVKVAGRFATLMLVQARGWPYVLTFHAVSCFIFLYGSHPFASHWLFWQDFMPMFNASNPSGTFIHSVSYMRILLAMLFLGITTSLKRLWVSTSRGRRLYLRYNDELEILLAKILIVAEVAGLGRQLENEVQTSLMSSGYGYAGVQGKQKQSVIRFARKVSYDSSPMQSKRSEDELSQKKPPEDGFGASLRDAGIGGKKIAAHATRPGLLNSKSEKLSIINSSSKLEIMNLFEEWEEPDLRTNAAVSEPMIFVNMAFDRHPPKFSCLQNKVSIKDVLQFRQALMFIDDSDTSGHLFTPAFGQTSNRQMCVESSEKLFTKLKQFSRQDNLSIPLLPFEILAEIAYDEEGVLNRDKAKVGLA